MANNPYINKVQYGNNTLIDLTGDTVTADKILQGYTAHDKSGAGIVGSYVPVETETVLWTNPSPASNFNAQVVNLTKNGVAEPYTNYKKIRVYYRQSTSNASEAYMDFAKELIDDFPLQGATLSNNYAVGGLPHTAGAYVQLRQVRKGSAKPTTSLWISLSYRVNASANTQSYGIPTKIVGVNMENGFSLKKYFYDKVFYSEYTKYDITSYASRSTINEGKIAVDTTTKTVYVYADITVTANQTSSDWWTVAFLGNLPFSYFPMGISSSIVRDSYQALITDESSPAYKPLIASAHDTTQGIVLISPYGYGLTANDRYVCYGSWQYL